MAGSKPSVRYGKTRGAYLLTYCCRPIMLAKGPIAEVEGPCYLAALEKFKALIEPASTGTGATRPGELSNATAANFDAQKGAIVHLPDSIRPPVPYRHKNAGRGWTTVILLTGESLDIVGKLAEKHKTGPLFRRSRRTGSHGPQQALQAVAAASASRLAFSSSAGVSLRTVVRSWTGLGWSSCSCWPASTGWCRAFSTRPGSSSKTGYPGGRLGQR